MRQIARIFHLLQNHAKDSTHNADNPETEGKKTKRRVRIVKENQGRPR